ncbi:MAG: hypothetical protein ACJ8AT_18365 [Hyalangium sp.]|uniref:hypothetical protein n=1 Tax=Hyalangium sp. TaxID=2028555 RepID=UPI00389AF057
MGGGGLRTGDGSTPRTGERPAMRTGDGSTPRTGERPAMRTGDGSTPRTGERPAMPDRSSQSSPRTGERPALPDRGSQSSPRTSTRPAVPAATFADALVQTKDGKVSTAAETLVMPKVETPPESPNMTRGGKTREMPAFKDGTKDGRTATPDSSPDTRDGRSVNDMDTPIGRGGGTRIVRMPEALNAKNRAEAGEGPTEPRQGKSPEPAPKARDGFGTVPSTGNRPALGNAQVKGPVLPVEELIPPTLDKLPDQEAVATRFASDGALLHQQIRPSDLPSTDRAVRLWAFFTAYAEAAAGKEGTPEGQEIFDKALKEQGFGEYRDAATGKDGLKAAQWVLASASPEEVLDRAEQVEFEPPPEVLLSESARHHEGARKAESAHPQEAARNGEPAQLQDSARPAESTHPPEMAHKPGEAPKLGEARKAEGHAHAVSADKDSAFTVGIERAPLERVPGQSEFVRVNPQQADLQRSLLLQPQNPQLRREDEEDASRNSFDEVMKKLSFRMKLGDNMLWNWLHRSRNGPEDSAIEKEKWNQLVFAAILGFVGLMLLIILVVAL